VTHFADRVAGRDFHRFFDKLEAKEIPYGRYEFILNRDDIRDPKLSTIRGTVDVTRSDVWLTLNPSGVYGSSNGREIVLDFNAPLNSTVSGVVKPLPRRPHRVWVRIQAAHSPHNVETGLDSEGRFRVDDELRGS
jgi:hypothetical protein